jgi:glycosyltransferase involved in cell wall biosynthesis/ubiquinone/menaquinone biosynthesis C-methylase UbiE
MRIAVLTSSYPRFPGDGAAPFVQSLARALVNHGHTVAVVAPYDEAVRPTPPEPGLSVHRFRYVWPARFHIMGHARSLENDARLRPLALALLPPFLVMATLRLLSTVRRDQCEVIHAHWVLPNGAVAAIVSRLTGVPYLVSLHGSDIYLARRFRLFGLVAGWALRRAHAVTACSSDLRQAAEALGARDVRLVPWGADPAIFRPRSVREGPPVVAALGRLVAKKGFDVLLEAWPAVVADVPDAQLRLGGDGPLREALARLALPSVQLTGPVPWDDVPRFLADADVFVLPSRRDSNGNVDGLPTVLLEAMSCGTAVVASDIGGVALVVQNGHNGLLTPPGDPVALARALRALLRDPERRTALGAAARRSVEERLNWHAVAREFEHLLDTARRSKPVTKNAGIPPSAYDRDYYLVHMDGATEFARTGGHRLAPRLAYALQLIKLGAGQRVLDLGCGRGEVAWQVAQSGAEAHGADFSLDALAIARGLDRTGSIRLEAAAATALPFQDETFDSVFMLDLVEHLYPDQLLETFREVLRILKPRGRLVVHTMPNADYYRFGYPVYRALARVVGRSLPRDPRRRWYRGETHVNIQTPRSLRRALTEAGFPVVDVWLQPLTGSHLANLAGALPVLRAVLCNDILAIAEKR